MLKLSSHLLIAALAAASLSTQAAHAASISPEAKSALEAALEDEYKAEAFYAAVMDKFGEVRPFSNIIRAEQMHSSELGAVMQTYGLDKGSNPYLGDAAIKASVPASIAEACQMGVDAEIANRDLYDKQLMPAVADYADIQTVFTALRDASENNHLPAFQRCGGQGGGQGMGQGMGKGHGMGQGMGHGMGQGMGQGNNGMRP